VGAGTASSAWRVEVTAPRIASEATAASNRSTEVVFFFIGLVLVFHPLRGAKDR
jgi:hypothetical protein